MSLQDRIENALQTRKVSDAEVVVLCKYGNYCVITSGRTVLVNAGP